MLRNKLKRRQIVLAVCLLVFCLGFFVLSASPFGALNDFLGRECSARVYDRNGMLLQVLPLEDGLRREWVPLSEIPLRAQEVFIAAEDKNFYRHFGVDFFAVARAVRQNWQVGRALSGASTITMQLARIIAPRKERVTLSTKIVEALNAMRLEARFSKKQILEMYLNSLPFGSNVEGIGSAARSFFGKTPDQLSDAQIHALAVIPRRPALYNPAVNADAAYLAALEIGKTTGFTVSQQEWLMEMNGAGTYAYPLLLPHITRYAAGSGGGAAQKGARPRSEIHLSVDGQLSLDAEQLITTRLEQNRDARITNGAAFLIDNSTGEILVWAGSGDLSAEGSEINGVLVKNQPGSAMKPFLYALALEMGFAPSMPLPDVPLDFGAEEIYVPLNFNNNYNGPVLFRNALASSLNVPAVYVLERVGIDNYLAKLSQLGFDSLAGTRERTGLSLALGSGEVTLYEMVRAFSVFARDGTLPQLSVESLGANNGALRGLRSAPQRGGADKQADKRTRSLAARGETSPRLFKKDTARIICSILSDKRARASGFAFSSVLAPPYPAIFKTGTANQFQDIIALGATTRYTAGVWMGNFSGATVVGRTGSSIPAEVVRALLDALVARDESAGVFAEPFALPETFALADVCALSGLAPSVACPSVTREFAPLGLEDALQMCTWHTNEGGRVAVRYPAEYQRWFMAKNTGASLFDAGGAPQFLYPADGAVFVYENAHSKTAQRLSVDCAGGNADTARLFVNGVYAGESGRPFFWSIPLALGEMRLRVECAGENAEISVMVR